MSRRLSLLLLCLAPALAESVLVDPLTNPAAWQLGGQRINYVLGRSSVGPSTEQARPGFATTLKLTYDFGEPRRGWLSYYHLGPPIPGTCRGLAFQLYGDSDGARLRLSIEDARGRWFQREAGRVDWTGWREVAVPVGAEGWRPLTRLGEAPLPPLMPINLREIAVVRSGPEQASGAIWISELRAETDLAPLDRIDGDLHRQAVRVPAALAVDSEALHRLVARVDVLEDPREHVVGARPAVGRGRALIEDVRLGAGPLGGAAREDVALAPHLEHTLLHAAPFGRRRHLAPCHYAACRTGRSRRRCTWWKSWNGTNGTRVRPRWSARSLRAKMRSAVSAAHRSETPSPM